MNIALLSAGIVLLVIVILHSVIGEMLIFRQVRAGTPSHVVALELLPARRWDALRSTWHLVSLLGLGLSTAMITVSSYSDMTNAIDATAMIMAATFVISGIYWLVGTKGKHPAWIGLLVIAGLVFMAV